MNTEDIKALAEILHASGLSAIEVGEGETRIRVERELSAAALPAQSVVTTVLPAGQDTMTPTQSGQAAMTTGQAAVITGQAAAASVSTTASSASVASAATAVPDGSFEENNQTVDFNRLIEVKSPLVGVYYSAPSPDAETFVSIGGKVKKGDVLCIIETMKLMNEIVAEQDGEIVDICIKNGDIAEYGQVLFKMY